MCCLLELDSVTSTPQWIRQPKRLFRGRLQLLARYAAQAMPRYVIHFGQVHSNQKWLNDSTCLQGKATVRQIREEDVASNISRVLDDFNMAVGQFWHLIGSGWHGQAKSMCMYTLTSNQLMERRSLNSVRRGIRWR